MNRLVNFLNNFCSKSKLCSNFSTSSAFSSNTGKTKNCQLEACELTSRAVIKVSGPDTHAFLQGIITNDIQHLETKPAIFTLFLNHQGRVLYDAILYSKKSGGEILIECDQSIKSKLAKHLLLFRVRKKVEISEANLQVWVAFDPAHNDDNVNQNEKNAPKIKDESEIAMCCTPIVNPSSKREDLLLEDYAIGDPRLGELGWRVLISEKQNFPPKDIIKTEESSYKELRYSLGVGEGIIDLPPANCFPLESNGDYLHGISFQKGCYIGQELTARTHHTGVIRKRLMPFRLSEKAYLPSDLDFSTLQIINEKAKAVGKVRDLTKSYGIALTRVEEATTATELKLGNNSITLVKPRWWPQEASKQSQFGKK